MSRAACSRCSACSTPSVSIPRPTACGSAATWSIAAGSRWACCASSIRWTFTARWSWAIAARPEADRRRTNAELQEVLFADDAPVLLDWLRSRPLVHVDAALGWMMVHAGLAPKWTPKIAQARSNEVQSRLSAPGHEKLLRAMFGNQPATWHPKLEGNDRLRAIINICTRMRFCSPKGTISFDHKGAPGSQKPGLYPWFDVPGHAKRELKIVCGHWSTLGLFMGLGVYAIDTGCVWGGNLTALRLDEELPQVFQVPGRPGGRDKG
jgi:bis(5'-nucleosyl)-tetraphosphatase (symmetrical)